MTTNEPEDFPQPFTMILGGEQATPREPIWPDYTRANLAAYMEQLSKASPEHRRAVEQAALRAGTELIEAQGELLALATDCASSGADTERRAGVMNRYTAALLASVREIQRPLWGPSYIDPSAVTDA